MTFRIFIKNIRKVHFHTFTYNIVRNLKYDLVFSPALPY
uniref:Uncharacterized protein n=1 Tax=Anguilla anguilla TaxID=7936 RepID=A0A0E9UQK8_ANGAN